MAMLPQKHTRKAPRHMDAPPAAAATAPRMQSSVMAVTGTSQTSKGVGTIKAVRTGTMAPEVKAAADQKAAWIGRGAHLLGDTDLVSRVRTEGSFFIN